MKLILFSLCVLTIAVTCEGGELQPIQKSPQQRQYIQVQPQYVVPQTYYVPRTVYVPQTTYVPVVVRPKVVSVPGGVFVHERAGLFGWHRRWNLYPSIAQ